MHRCVYVFSHRALARTAPHAHAHVRILQNASLLKVVNVIIRVACPACVLCVGCARMYQCCRLHASTANTVHTVYYVHQMRYEITLQRPRTVQCSSILHAQTYAVHHKYFMPHTGSHRYTRTLTIRFNIVTVAMLHMHAESYMYTNTHFRIA